MASYSPASATRCSSALMAGRGRGRRAGADGADDHAGLLGAQVAAGEAGPDPVVGAQVVAEAYDPGGGGRVCWVWWASQFAVDVAPTSVPTWTSSACAATRAFELDDLGLETGSARPASTLLRGAHGPHRCVDHTVRNRAHPRGRGGHLVVGCGHRGHGSTQALTTDTQRPRSRLSTGVQVTNRSRSAIVHTPDGLRRVVSRLGLAALAPQPPGREAGGGPQPLARRTRPCCLSAADPGGPAGRAHRPVYVGVGGRLRQAVTEQRREHEVGRGPLEGRAVAQHRVLAAVDREERRRRCVCARASTTALARSRVGDPVRRCRARPGRRRPDRSARSVG